VTAITLTVTLIWINWCFDYIFWACSVCNSLCEMLSQNYGR